MRWVGMLFVLLGVTLSGVLAGAVLFTGWLLSTQDGARWLIDWVPRMGIAELQVAEVEGTLLGPLYVRDLKLETDGVTITLDQAQLEWSPTALLTRSLRVRTLSGGTLRVRVKDRPPREKPPPMIPELPLGIVLRQASLDRLELALPGTEAPQIVETLEVRELRWRGAKLAAEHLAASHALTGPLHARLDAELARQSVTIKTLSVQTAGQAPAQIAANGTLNLDAQVSRIDLAWSALRWPLQGAPQITSREGQLRVEGTLQDLAARGAFALGDSARIEGIARRSAERIDAQLNWTRLAWPLSGAARVTSSSGAVQISGTPQAYRYTIEAQLAAEGQQGAARAAGSGALDHVVLDTLRLAVAKSEIEGRGRIEWKPAFIADADLRVKNLDPGVVAPNWPGRLNGTLKARTELRDRKPLVRFEVGLKDSYLRRYPLALDARGDVNGSTVVLETLSLASAATRLSAQGQVTPPFDASATLDSPDLAALWPGLSGSAKLDVRLRGPIKAPHVTAKGSVQTFGYDQLSIAHIALAADLDQAGPWTLDVQADDLRGPAEVASARVQIDGQAGDHRLRVNVDATPADAQIEARGHYDAARRQWSGEIASGRFAPTGLAEWTLEEPAALRVDAASQQLEPACWRALDSRLCGQFIREAERLRTALRVEQIDFAYFASFLPPGWELRGGIDGTALAELRGARLVEASAELATDPIELRREGELLLRAERGTMRIEETAGRTLATLRLPLQGGQVAFDAELAPGPADYLARPLSAQLEVGLSDLGFLRVASEELEQASGKLEGRMTWSGTLRQARAAGEMRLSDGRLRLATPGIELREIGATASANADGTLRIAASATSGEGKLQLDGEASTAGDKPSARLTIRGENFQAANTAEARAWISPKLDLMIDGRDVELSGEVDVPRAIIKPVSFDGGVGPSADQIIVSDEETPVERAGFRLSADVRLNLGENISFEGFGLKTQLEGSVRAIEQPGRVGSGRGEVRLVGGRYKAYGQDLQIEYGRLLFNGGPLTEPAVEIRAQRQPREDVMVGVLVRGTLDRPEFSLYSTPAMPRERQLSWLVLGRSLDEEGSAADDKAMIANAALALGLGGTDFLAQNLRGGLKLDEVSIGAAPGEDAQTARFTVGKYLSPKLYVSYGIGLFQPGQVFKLLYTLGRGFKFSTESGVNTGGDLLYTVERK